MLTTDPSYQRLGAASLLMDWGIREAEKLSLDCWLQATPNGWHFYHKRGFEDVSSFVIDLGELGWDDGDVWKRRAMEREFRTVLMRRRGQDRTEECLQ